MNISFKVKQQTIVKDNSNEVPRIGSREYLYLIFTFSEDWSELTKKLYISDGTYTDAITIEEGTPVQVPNYYTQNSSFTVTLIGSYENKIVPTNVVTCLLEQSNEVWEEVAPNPESITYQQLIDALQKIENIDVVVETVTKAVLDAQKAADNADKSATQAENVYNQILEIIPDITKNVIVLKHSDFSPFALGYEYNLENIQVNSAIILFDKTTFEFGLNYILYYTDAVSRYEIPIKINSAILFEKDESGAINAKDLSSSTILVLNTKDFQTDAITGEYYYDVSQIQGSSKLIYIDKHIALDMSNYNLISNDKSYRIKGGELFSFTRDDFSNITLNKFQTDNEWKLIENITLEEAVQEVSIPYEKLQYKEVHIEAVIIPTNKTITSQDVAFGKSGTTYWNTKVSAKATGKIYAIMDVYLSPLNITIFDGTVSAYCYSLSGGSFKMSYIRNGLIESNLTSVCSSEEKRMWIRTSETNPMAVGTQIKVWGR